MKARAIPALIATFRRRREQAGISQRQFAEIVSTDWSATRDFERGRCSMGVVKLEQRFGALGLELAPVPMDLRDRIREAAEFLKSHGWSVEPPAGNFW